MATFINPNRILKRRYETEKRLISSYTTLSKYQLAEYFCTSPSVIERDFKTADILKGTEPFGQRHANQGFFDISSIVRRRNESFERDIRRGEDPAEVYARAGLWRKPLNLSRPNRDIYLPRRLKESERKALRHAAALIEIGFSCDEAFRYLGISSKHKPIIRSQFERTGISLLKEDEGISEYVSKACSELVDSHSPSRKTGAKALAKTLHRLLGIPESYTISYAGSKTARIEKDAEKAYELWLSGMTEDDIANNVLHVSRPTVSKYIFLYKEGEKHRNPSRKTKEKHKKTDEEILEMAKILIASGKKLTITEVARRTHHSRARVSNTLISRGMIEKRTQKST